MAAARSNYRQVRVTLTEEAGGWVTIRVMVKPLDAGWAIKDTVYHHRARLSVGTLHWTNLLAWASELVLSERLPAD